MATAKGLELLEKSDQLLEKINELNDEEKLSLDKVIVRLNQISDILDQNEIKAQRTEIDKKLIESVQKARKENQANGRKGSIRIGRIANLHEPGRKNPITFGYMNIVVVSSNKTKIGSQCSPYVLKDGSDQIHENIWQFSKIYKRISEQNQKNGWKWPKSKFLYKTKSEPLDLSKKNITPDYWKWRKAGMEFDKSYLRYPVGEDRHRCCGVLWPKNFEDDPDNLYKEINNPDAEFEILDIVESRRKVYAYIYMKLLKESDDFKALKSLLDNGTNIQLLEVDVCQNRELFKMPSGVYGESGIGSIEATKDNILLALNDKNYSFGHGYSIAALLAGFPEWCTTAKLAAHLKD